MRISTKIRTSATTLTIAAGVLAPTAAASGDHIVLRRDGSKAVPFERNLNSTATARGDDIVLRRDGSKAVPFEPNLNPPETSAKATEGFDWGDAGLGTGALVVVLGAAGAFSLRGRRVAPMPSRRADDALQKRTTVQ
jgi:hypothetical protein